MKRKPSGAKPEFARLIEISLAVALALMWTGCGGGSSASNAPPSPPAANLSVSSLTIGNQFVGVQHTPASITLTNTGGMALTISGITVTGTNSGEFVESNTCGTSLAGGANCTISVAFTAATTGTRTATLNIADSAAGSPQTVALSGTGVTPTQIGTASGVVAACSSVAHGDLGEPNGTCYNVTVSQCPGIADQVVGVKVNNPTGTKGTVTFLVGGGGGPEWYDQNFMFGTLVIDQIAQAGFTTAQIDFYAAPTGFPAGGVFAGWLTGPGGVRALSCRFSTVSKWIHDNIRQAGQPFCHTGNSGGAAAPFYALAYHGFDTLYNFIEPTSGPPFTRIDKGCICQPPNSVQTPCGNGLLSECYGNFDSTAYLDPAYDPLGHQCSSSNAGSTQFQQVFFDDSLATPQAVYDYPDVNINFLFAGQDTESALPQAQEWIPQISAKNNPIPQACVADAPHPIPDVMDGAQQIAADVIAKCQ